MAKLRYLRKRKRGKLGDTDYYWQCKPEIAEKYGVEKFVSLGKDEKTALIKWQELNKKLSYNKGFLMKNGILPIIEQLQLDIQEGTLKHITELYFNDRRFKNLSTRTAKEYSYMAKKINNDLIYKDQKIPFGNLIVSGIDRMFCKTVYEKLLLGGKKRMAQGYIAVLSNILQTAIDHGYLKGENPCTKMRIEKNKPRDQVWTKDEFDIFCKTALELGYNGIYIAINLAYYTAQRQTDILELKWSDFSGNFDYWYLIQSKTNAKVHIPIGKINKLQNILINCEQSNEFIIIDEFDNKSYTHRARLFGDRFEEIREKSEIRGELQFRDLRRTAILALQEAGCTPEEIASISGHSLHTIIAMLEIYAPKTRLKAENAMDKLNKNR